MSDRNRLLKLYGLFGLVALLLNLLLAACGDATPTSAGASQTGAGLSFLFNKTPTPTTAAVTTETTAAATTQATTPSQLTTVATTTTAAATPVVVQRYNPNFAAYKEQPSTIKPNFPAYSVSSGLSNVTNIADFKLSDAQKKLIEQNYFAVEPAQFKQFFQAYESFRYDQIPTYISTDSVAHVYHLLFDKLLRDTERNFLIKDLIGLTTALYDASLAQYNDLKGTALEGAVTRNVAFTAVARKLAEPKAALNSLPDSAAKLVDAEMKLIDGTGGFALSPIMGSDYQEDYSQYIPRGHYTISEELKNYFRGMMWIGRMNFRLKNDSETQSALLLSQAILNGKFGNQKARDLWLLIYEPTAFFVGSSDDLTYLDYANLATAIWSESSLKDLKTFADATKFAQFKKSADTLPPPKINSMYTLITESQETQIKGMRLMGQRFTLDAYIFQNLIWRRVGTLEKPRDLPKGLDVFAAFGSEQAQKLLQQAGETNFANFSTQLDKVKTQVAAISNDTWTQNLYWGWLYNLKPLVEKRGTGYPKYMQNELWQRKQLVTGLASWTELKHDTILYAKQVYAERGGGPEDLPTGFVETEPAFYARMAALAQLTRTGLEQRNLIDKSNADVLQRLEKTALTLKTIAEKELTNQKLTNDEVIFIAYWGATIESYTLEAADADATGRKYIDKQDAALVADVATGLQEVLTEATGRVNLIYVVVPINGKVILTKGAVYSQYEFTVKPNERLTDAAWQQRLNEGKAPALEDWKKSYIAPGVAIQPAP
ncbi:DUF3160 domain-containing protein [Candidatus Chlorohelix sp.]|uniref:DUF3160 domain-containing protein n=1 Tax=Candidatus Chlorohelix sp. TaxID=3139201 RepID=UPI0030248F6E